MRVTGARVLDELAAGEVAFRMDLVLGFFRALLGGGVIQKWGVEHRTHERYEQLGQGLPAALPVALLQSPFHATAGMVF